MKYAKPEITALAAATEAVQSSDVKQEQMYLDHSNILATTAAYEADE